MPAKLRLHGLTYQKIITDVSRYVGLSDVNVSLYHSVSIFGVKIKFHRAYGSSMEMDAFAAVRCLA